jgi:pyruvate dehydrogenase E2 component (dihydrolipoamide acetyltransferase)
MPKIGQAMAEGTVIQWHYKDGEHVQQGAIIVTIETDKATYDLEAPASGTLHILVREEQEVAVGVVVAEIGEASPRAGVAVAPLTASIPASTAARVPARTKVLASPKAKQLAAQYGIDLSTLTPSAADGMISAEDVQRAVANKDKEPQPLVAEATAIPPASSVATGRSVRQRRQLTGIRKTSARRVQEAWQTIPHIVQMVDVDATALLATRSALKPAVPSLTLNDLILHTAARVMAELSDLNGMVDGDALVLYDGVDVGFAADTPRGLVVPVIRRAEGLSVAALAAESQRLIEAARSGRLAPENIGNASLTVSNLGMFGIRSGTPVINLGESILVFVGVVEDRPVVLDRQVVIRPILTLSIAYDHRLADGVAAARFTRRLKESLESSVESLASQDSPESRVQSLESEVRDPSTQPLAPSTQEKFGVRSSESNTQHPTPNTQREVVGVSVGTGYAVQVRSRGHAWVLDEPTADGGTDAGPDPVTAFLGALLSCMTIAFKASARRRKVTIERIEGQVQGTPQGHVRDIAMTLHVWSPDPEENVRALLEVAKRGCYVSGALKPEIEFKVELVVSPPHGPIRNKTEN